MIDRIDDELKRAGTINDRILISIVDAVNIYKRERFRFNETFTTTFLTVGGQQNYSIFGDTNYPTVSGPQQIYKMDWMTITIPPAVFDLPRMQPEEILILTQTGTQMGQPYCFAFANEQVMLYPIPPTGTPGTGPVSFLTNLVGGSGYTPGVYAGIPATGGHGAGLTLNVTVNSFGNIQSTTIANGGFGYQVGDVVGMILGIGSGYQQTVSAVNATGQGPFQMTIGGHVELQSPTGNYITGQPNTPGLDTQGNRWFTDAERLIRSRAKYELAINYIRDDKLAALMSPYAPAEGQQPGAAYDAYQMLVSESNRLQMRGRIRPEQF